MKGWVRLFHVGLQLPCFSGAFDGLLQDGTG